jgi:aspartate/methionine/tyrosine aminotransferase
LLELSKQCCVFVVTNPHNPTGNIVPSALLKQIAAEVAARGGTLIVDEVFSVHGQEESAIGLGEQVMVIGSLSKMYGLPGLRLGWVAAHKERLQRLRTMQQYLTLSLNAMTVGMGAKILETPQLFSRADLLQKNRRILMDWADANKQFVCISHPAGGTTVCLTVKTPMTEEDLFARFLANNVLLVPGNRCFDFGQGVRWFRLGYGTDTDALRRGLERIGDVVATVEDKPPNPVN